MFKYSLFTCICLLLSLVIFAQSLTLKDIDLLRNGNDKDVSKILEKKGWQFLETKKHGKVYVYGFFDKDSDVNEPLSLIAIGTEDHLKSNAFIYYTREKSFYLDILFQLKKKKFMLINTISKKNKTIDFYKFRNTIIGNKRLEDLQVEKYSIEAYSNEDYLNMLSKL